VVLISPDPVLGEESFLMTLVGAVSRTIEIVLVTARNGNVMTVLRGQQGTTAQPFGVADQAYQALTANDADQFRDAMFYYLGPSDFDPVDDNFGNPVISGMLYFNLPNQVMKEYRNGSWGQFGTIVNISTEVEFLWANHPDISGGGEIQWPDDNGNSAPDIDPSDLLAVFIHGNRLQDAGTSGIDIGFIATDGSPGSIAVTAGAVPTGEDTAQISVFLATVGQDTIENGLPIGGDEGQRLVKNSGVNFDAGWVDSPPLVLVQEGMPAVDNYNQGQRWLRTSDMTEFMLYTDADSKQWVAPMNSFYPTLAERA
jgi:hypothetical protein